MFRFWRKIRMIEFNSSIWFTWAMMERKKGVRMFSTQAHLSQSELLIVRKYIYIYEIFFFLITFSQRSFEALRDIYFMFTHLHDNGARQNRTIVFFIQTVQQTQFMLWFSIIVSLCNILLNFHTSQLFLPLHFPKQNNLYLMIKLYNLSL